MVGKCIKNLQHFIKSVGDSKTRKVILICDGYPVLGECVNVNGYILIFNRHTSNIHFHSEEYEKTKQFNTLCELYHKYGCVIQFDNNHKSWYQNKVQTTFILPENYDELFAMFVKQNNKQYTQLMSKYGCSESNEYVNYFFNICNNSINFFAWAIKNLYSLGVRFSLINYVLTWNEKYSQFANKLPKGTITAYNGKKDVFNLISELNNIRFNKRVNDSINEFNTLQKRILKENVESDKLSKTILNNFGKLSDTKRRNFIRKMSTIVEYGDIINQMSQLCEMHFSWDKSSLMFYINNTSTIKCSVIFDNNNVVIVEVKDYETVKRLAKTTNWCISKNKKYWNDYIEHNSKAKQYIIFDFNKEEDSELSIVGFTNVANKGITHAHSFTNNNLMGKNNIPLLVSFDVAPRNIYRILNEYNVPLSLFSKKLPLNFKWDRDSLFKFLKDNGVENEGNYDIVLDENDKVVIIAKNKIFANMFHRELFRNFDSYMFETNEFVYFFDFSKQDDDDNKLMFSIIFNNDCEENASRCYNCLLNETEIAFDSKLIEFGLEYDLIKRINTPLKRFDSALKAFDIVSLNTMLQDKGLIDELKRNKENNSELVYSFNDSLFSYKSVSLIEVFYKNNVKLTDFLPVRYISDMILGIATELHNHCHSMRGIPTLKDVEDLYNKKIQNGNKCLYIGFFHAFTMILNAENDPNITERLRRHLHGYDYKRDGLTEFLIFAAFKDCDLNSTNIKNIQNLRYTFNYCVNNNIESAIEYFMKNVSEPSIKKELLAIIECSSVYSKKYVIS